MHVGSIATLVNIQELWDWKKQGAHGTGENTVMNDIDGTHQPPFRTAWVVTRYTFRTVGRNQLHFDSDFFPSDVLGVSLDETHNHSFVWAVGGLVELLQRKVGDGVHEFVVQISLHWSSGHSFLKTTSQHQYSAEYRLISIEKGPTKPVVHKVFRIIKVFGFKSPAENGLSH